MLQKTHTLAGLVAAECVIIYYNQPLLSWESGAALLIGCLVGPLADIDKRGSTMAKILLPLSWLLQILRVKHRTMTHSLLFLVLLGYLLTPLPDFYYWTIIAAYASHPLIDLLNDQGVALLWPLNRKFRFLPKPVAIDTGSLQEIVFRTTLAVLAIILPFALWDSF
ncbi:metal-dependent hydrolase [Paenibacillus lutimineralis]|uniref:Metal-dependent hydrolase n=1 Tax=Paenibacillus lutimineralis TaxID=2707005 RepID=A0A3S9V0A2_9BACL|nr:metal-dependent hydrolase [Paenibacillus lutimineralis]AZS15960.1 metal-dependent hydrolase [Paenibacillus lutimineralis]